MSFTTTQVARLIKLQTQLITVTFIGFVLFSPLTNAQTFKGKVVGITDGDTLTVLVDNTISIKIRIAYIDAPEKKQAFGQQSKKALSSICFGRVAEIHQLDVDVYKRTIANVFCDRNNAGQWLVYNGFAWVFDKYVSGHNIYYDAQNVAKLHNRGLWVDNNPVPPWDWRKKKHIKPSN